MTQGVLVISFADGFAGAATIARPILDALGLRAVEFFPAGAAGIECHLSEAQLLELDAAGWDVASHALRASGPMTRLSQAEALRVLVQSHDYLTGLGIARGARIFGPPGQYWTASLNPLAVAAGYDVVTVPAGSGGMLPQGWEDLSFQPCGLNVTLDDIAAFVAGLADGEIGLLSFHNVQTMPLKPNAADAARVTAVATLAAASGRRVVTFSELLDE